MASSKQENPPKKPLVKPKRPKSNPKTSKSEFVTGTGLVVSSALLSVASTASLIGVQHAAQAATLVFSTIQNVQANKKDFEILAEDAAGLIVAIWNQQLKSKNPNEWASPEIMDMVEELKVSLEEADAIAKRQAKRNIATRVVFNIADAGQIRQIRDKITSAVLRFEVLSHLNLNEVLGEVAAKQQELSQDMKNFTAMREKEDNSEEEDSEEGEEEEGSEEEGGEEEISQPPPNQNIYETSPWPPRPGPTPFVGQNSAAIHGFAFTNGSGNMVNSGVGNIVYTNISNVGNNNSKNYYG